MTNEIHYWYDPKLKQYVECSADEAWKREGEEEKNMELGPAYVPTVKKTLDDEGTRFIHISDLIDYLNDGLCAVENSLARYENTNDHLRKKRLENAIILVQNYRDFLANRDGQKWAMNNLLDACVPERGVLEGIRKARIEATKTATDKKFDSPEDSDPIGV
jgi:hypothetical protein